MNMEMKKVLLKHKYLLFLIILTVAALIISLGHYNNILLDVGREVYYPARILKGKILYKDIFNIYGPFSYMFNAFLYKVFGAKLSTLFFAGSLSAAGIVTAVYLIAKKFLTPFLSFSIGFFTIITGICASHLFNFSFPYSYGMLYGTLAFLYSLFFLIKYKKENTPIYLYVSSFLGGIAITNKYDFLIYGLILLFVIFQTRDFKLISKSIISFISVPVILFSILFSQGLQVSDLINFAGFLKDMAHSETLKYFYSTQGLYFRKETPVFMGIFFVLTGLILSGLIFSQKISKKCKIISSIIFIACTICTYLIANPAEFIFLPFFLLILSIIKFKTLLQHPKTFILTVSALAISLKTFWGMTYMNYGNYYMPAVLITFFALLAMFLKKNWQKPAGIFIIITAISIFVNYIKLRPDYKIQTENGTILTSNYSGQATDELINYINKNTKKTDRIVIFPEGLIVNFLTERPSDDYYNSLLPLYAEAPGDEKFIEHFKNNMPEYIIFNNQNMKDYYFEYICRDYAKDFCGFVSENYNQTARISNGLHYLIYKKRN